MNLKTSKNKNVLNNLISDDFTFVKIRKITCFK